MTTLCPSLRSLTAVSTIRERVDRRGSCVFSSTMEEVPFGLLVSVLPNNDYCLYRFQFTELNDDGETFLHDLGLDLQVARGLLVS